MVLANLPFSPVPRDQERGSQTGTRLAAVAEHEQKLAETLSEKTIIRKRDEVLFHKLQRR